jgi:hypothetical protein
VTAVKPAKAVLAGGARIGLGSAAARHTSSGVRRVAAGVRCAVADAAKEESFTYQAEARALAAPGLSPAATGAQPHNRLRRRSDSRGARAFPRVAQVNRLLDLIVNSLYSNKEVRRRSRALACGSMRLAQHGERCAWRVALSGARPGYRASRCSCASSSATRPTRWTRSVS